MVITASVSSAQAPVKTDYTLNVQVEFVELPVSVIDKQGQSIRGLQEEHFKVYEDKILQDITLFKQEDAPVSVGLVIDTSSSMRDKHDRVSAAAMTFVKESNPNDETFIVSFADHANLEHDFTKDTTKLSSSLSNIPSRGMTSLYDAVLFAAKHIDKGVYRKKVLLIVTDGEDNKSRHSLDDALEELRESRLILYAIGITSQSSRFFNNGPFKGESKKALEKFAKTTGGKAFFPSSVEDVDDVCKRIARDLRTQYTIGYRPSNTTLDGSWRGVKVQVTHPRGHRKPRHEQSKATMRRRCAMSRRNDTSGVFLQTLCILSLLLRLRP